MQGTGDLCAALRRSGAGTCTVFFQTVDKAGIGCLCLQLQARAGSRRAHTRVRSTSSDAKHAQQVCSIAVMCKKPLACMRRATSAMAHRLERTGRQQRPCSLVAAVKLLLLAVSHGSVAGQLWAQADAVPVLPAIRSDPLEGLDMRCKGDDDYLKGCLMRDLYFDMKADTFKFSGRKIGSADTMPPEVTRRRFAEETCVLVTSTSNSCLFP